MQYRFLGDTGLQVSVLSLGTMTFGGTGSDFFKAIGGVPAGEAASMVDLAQDYGVNLIDTADVYSRGVSEEMLGKAVARKRDKFIIATKVHGRMSDGVNDLGQSRHHILRSCEQSLKRLGTDYIDLYQLHGYDAFTGWQECLSALSDLVSQGKVRYIGCSNLAAWQVMKALSVAELRGFRRFVCFQGNYNLVSREAELEILPLCAEEQLGFLVWSPLAGGFLTGKYQKGESGRRQRIDDVGAIDVERARKVFEAMRPIAARQDVSLAQVALNYVRSHKNVTSLIVGASNLDQLKENLSCVEWSLTNEDVAALNQASSFPLPYPHWHQVKYNARRAFK